MNLDALISSATRPERKVPVCLRGDLAARVDELRQEALKKRGRRSSLADPGEAEQELQQAIEEAKAATVTFVVSAVTRHRVSQIMSECPPREDDEDDQRAGYNLAQYTWQMLRESIVNPKLTDEQFVALFGTRDTLGDGVLGPAQFQALDDAVAAVNFSRADIPFG